MEDGHDPEWQNKYSTLILKLGCLRKCMSCRQLHGENVVSESVAKGNVVSTSQRGWHKCDSCGNLKHKTEFGHVAWQYKMSSTRKSLCTECSVHVYQCDLCKQVKRKEEFSESAWKHVAAGSQRTLCKECCNPVCTAPDCKTCKVCRDVTCKKRIECTNDIRALNSKHLPTEQA
eukprot:5485623-Karenia_brevis.AAC.1